MNSSRPSNHLQLTENRFLSFEKTLIMGIINITDDSFYNKSRVSCNSCLEKVDVMLGEGLDILDLGAESTRPGAEETPASKELEKIVPVVSAIRKKHPHLPISVDTRKSIVALAALEAGADIINDISGFVFDADIPKIAAEHGAVCILMHSQGTPQTMQANPQYDDIVKDISSFFTKQMDMAHSAGLCRDRIILDPGIGFGKTLEHNLTLLNHIRDFTELGRPLLVGASRKGMIGKILGLQDPSDRLEGTLAITAQCALQGVSIVRVHDVQPNARVAKVCDAMRLAV